MANCDNNTLGAAISILSLIVNIFLAVIALRSASSAKEAAEHARLTEHRTLLREIVSAAQGVIGEIQRLNASATQLINGYQTLFAFAGRSSRESSHTSRVESKKNEIPAESMKAEASKLIENPHSLRGASAEDLALCLAKIEGNLIRLQTLREEFDAELTSVEDQIRPYRENAINRGGFGSR